MLNAWGGPYKGTVSDISASEWTSYLPVANHPEYPSATASYCGASAQVGVSLTIKGALLKKMDNVSTD